jgi:hypothetical protein
VSGAGATTKLDPAPRKPTVVSGGGRTMGGLFKASDAGAVIELPSRSRLVVAPSAELRIFPLPQLLALSPGPRTWTWSFSLQSGRVDVELPSSGRAAVLTQMGRLSAIATSGHVAYRVDGNEATTVNLEGDVRTLLAGHWQNVPLGWLATLSKDDPNATAKQGIVAPTLLGGQRMWFAPSTTVTMHGFHWNRVAGAEHYDLRVRRLSDDTVVDQRSTTQTELADTLTPVEPGRYGVTVRSVDSRGLEGSWSPETEVRVIGVLLPPGCYSNEKAIYLGIGQHVQFTNTEGLEMTYLGAGKYFPAAAGASLYRGQKTVIGFRMPGAIETAVARLEPRDIFADVRFSPRGAVWPRDPVSIDIQLKSKTGVEIPAFLQVLPVVSLGTDPIAVSFERQGDVLHAVLPPSTTPGPWVVRVDVADQYGVALGHDFLEIAAQPSRSGAGVRLAKPVVTGAGAATTATRPAPEPSLASRN